MTGALTTDQSYFERCYPAGLGFISWHWMHGSMPWGGAKGQTLEHCKLDVPLYRFNKESIFKQQLILMHSYFIHFRTTGSEPGVGLYVKV